MTQDFTDDVLAHVQRERDELQQEVTDLEAELVRIKTSHWEMVDQLGKAHSTIEELTDEIRMMERQIDRRVR